MHVFEAGMNIRTVTQTCWARLHHDALWTNDLISTETHFLRKWKHAPVWVAFHFASHDLQIYFHPIHVPTQSNAETSPVWARTDTSASFTSLIWLHARMPTVHNKHIVSIVDAFTVRLNFLLCWCKMLVNEEYIEHYKTVIFQICDMQNDVQLSLCSDCIKGCESVLTEVRTKILFF